MKLTLRLSIKILLTSFFLYSLVWFAGVHFIKKNIATSLNQLNSTNNKVTFSNIAISGFPLQWTINIHKLSNSAVELDNISDLQIDNIKLNLNIFLRSIEVIIPNSINLFIGQDFGLLTKYTIKPIAPLVLNNAFNTSLYLLLWQKNINFIDLLNKSVAHSSNIIISKNDSENASISDFSFSCDKDKAIAENKLNILLSFTSKSLNPNSLITSAIFATNMSLSLGLSDSTPSSNYIKAITINDFATHINNSMKFSLTGNLDFSNKLAMPQGSFEVAFGNYPRLIEVLSMKLKRFFHPKDFTMQLTHIITKASMQPQKETSNLLPSNIDQDAKFIVTFSDYGIAIGGISLNELKIFSK